MSLDYRKLAKDRLAAIDALVDQVVDLDDRVAELEADAEVAGSAAWGDLEQTHGRWRDSTDEETRTMGQRSWRAANFDGPIFEVTRLNVGWHVVAPTGAAFSLDDARELVQLMEKVEAKA